MKLNRYNILLVEDDINLGFLLLEFLQFNGFDVKLFRDGEGGYNAFKNNHFDFCILDIMLPSMDGVTLAARIKKLNEKIPVIFLTAKSLKEDKIKGFKIGVDDYITKPFDEEELLYRIKAILKRTKGFNSGNADSTFKIGHYSFNYKNQLLSSKGNSRRLTSKESNILRFLCISKNNIVRREDLLMSVWGDDDYFIGRSLDVFISKLRRYLNDDPSVKIECIPKVGLILTDNEKPRASN